MGHLTASQINLFLDEALLPVEKAGVVAHLQNCPICQAKVASLQTLFIRLDELPLVPLPYDLTALVMNRIEPARRRQPLLVQALLVVQLGLTGLLGFWLVPGLLTGISQNSFSFTFADNLISQLQGWWREGAGWLDNLGQGIFANQFGLTPWQWVLAGLSLGLVWWVCNRWLLASINRVSKPQKEVA